MIKEHDLFFEFMAAMGIGEEKFAQLHPAVKKAWWYHYDTVNTNTSTQLKLLLNKIRSRQ